MAQFDNETKDKLDMSRSRKNDLNTNEMDTTRFDEIDSARSELVK
jgi:hypothetical protein